MSSAGAGDALLGGVLSGLAAGLPFAAATAHRATLAARPLASALDLGALVAAFKVTSPHTIPPDLSLDAVLAFAREHGVAFGEAFRRAPAGRRGAPPCLLRLAPRRRPRREAAAAPAARGDPRPRAGAGARGQRRRSRRTATRPRPRRCSRRALRRHRVDVELYDVGFLERSRHPYVRRDRNYRGRHNLVARVPGDGPRPEPPAERAHRHGARRARTRGATARGPAPSARDASTGAGAGT